MNRYRIALAAAVVVIAGAVIATLVRQAGPASSAPSGASALFPVDQRYAVPDFTGIDGWINSPPLHLSELRGHVVLVDFWTFSCVNCVRTVPHLRELYDAYRAKGLVIVGVHSPEFDFEKVSGNERAAVQRLGITWPVAVDSEMATWTAYSNNYWPAEYLIDQSGKLAYVRFGEGDYDVTDSAVAALLGVHRGAAATPAPVTTAMTPELYAGSTRGMLADGVAYAGMGSPAVYPDPGPPHEPDHIQVTGGWIDHGEYLEASAAGHVRLRFRAADVFVVAGTTGGDRPLSVRLDGADVPAPLAGPDLSGSGLTVTRQDLFHVVTHESGGYHLIDLAVPAGFELYTFTFG